MEAHRNSTSTSIGFCLLPSELIQYIILQLALPDIFRLRTVNKTISSIISDKHFVRDYNLQSSTATWLFIYRKRWRRHAVLHGFTDCSNRWSEILIGDMLKPVVPPGEDLYFLTASGNVFLFALNTSQEVISVNPMTKVVKKIPPGPLGPRGTSSWRRSGMKLLSCPSESNSFTFLFAEIYENRPILFEYNSKVDKWSSKEAREHDRDMPSNIQKRGENIFLSALNGRSGSVLIGIGPYFGTPVVLRPRYIEGENEEGQLAIGFSRGNSINRLHVYGDGHMIIVRSESISHDNKSMKMLKDIELWSLSSNGRLWVIVSRVPDGLLGKIKKPYGAMMGCVEQRDGMIRVILMSNLDGSWDIIWLCYDVSKNIWSWLPLPDCNMKGSNMAGVTFSSGLTLS